MRDYYEIYCEKLSDRELSEITVAFLADHPRPWTSDGAMVFDKNGAQVLLKDLTVNKLASQLTSLRVKVEGEKKCSKCKEVKPVLQFYQHPGGRKQRDSICIVCRRTYAKKYQAKRRESLLE